jgi:flagella basal body P-ring formation protein FlgA
MLCSRRLLILRDKVVFLLLVVFILFCFSSLSVAQEGEKLFINLALKNIDFAIPGRVERLLVNGRVLNQQVIENCKINSITPLHRLTVKRAGRYLAQLKVKCENSFLTRTLNVELEIDAEVWGFRTIDVVERGEALVGKVKREKFLLSTIRGELFNGDPAKVVARIKLLPGMAVLKRFVEVPFAIKRGQLVKVVAEKGGIYVETLGRALQNGRVGDIIKVKNVYSGKIIEGRVKDEESVVVIF